MGRGPLRIIVVLGLLPSVVSAPIPSFPPAGGQVLLVDEATSGMDSVADNVCTASVITLCKRLTSGVRMRTLHLWPTLTARHALRALRALSLAFLQCPFVTLVIVRLLSPSLTPSSPGRPCSAPPLMPQVSHLLVSHRLATVCPISDSIVALELGRVSAIQLASTGSTWGATQGPGGVYGTLWTGPGQLLPVGKEGNADTRADGK
jgi:hypothetical protein